MVTGLSTAWLSQAPRQYTRKQTMKNILLWKISTSRRLIRKMLGVAIQLTLICGTNVIGTNLPQLPACPSIPGKTPVTMAIPVVTQRGGRL